MHRLKGKGVRNKLLNVSPLSRTDPGRPAPQPEELGRLGPENPRMIEHNLVKLTKRMRKRFVSSSFASFPSVVVFPSCHERPFRPQRPCINHARPAPLNSPWPFSAGTHRSKTISDQALCQRQAAGGYPNPSAALQASVRE